MYGYHPGDRQNTRILELESADHGHRFSQVRRTPQCYAMTRYGETELARAGQTICRIRLLLTGVAAFL